MTKQPGNFRESISKEKQQGQGPETRANLPYSRNSERTFIYLLSRLLPQKQDQGDLPPIGRLDALMTSHQGAAVLLWG